MVTPDPSDVLGSLDGTAQRQGSRWAAVPAWVERHPFAAFVELAYAFSWSFWLPAVLGGGRVPFRIGGLGPLIAAGVVTRLTGGALPAGAAEPHLH